jgi:hypothetical protein
MPFLHLSRVYEGKGDKENERTMIEHAINAAPSAVDAWAALYAQVRRLDSEEAAIRAVEELADAEPYKKSSAPYVALQGLYSSAEETRERALAFAQKAVDRNDSDPLALISLSALHGQKGDLAAVIALLSKHEAKMASDVRLANNYFEALFQTRQLDRVTKLLNALAGSSNREVKQFAIERSRAVAQYLQQQQQKLTGAQSRA